MATTETQAKPTIDQLIALKDAAASDPGQPLKPAAAEVIGGVEYRVQYHMVNRKCFDFMPTPTAMFKIDGKRVSRKVFFGAAY